MQVGTKEAGHSFLARLGKTKLRPGGQDATNWLLSQAGITSDSQVLEVACNMGTTMIRVAETYRCHVSGVDLSEEAVAKANCNIQAHGLADLALARVGDATSLPFDDNSFDVIVNEAMLTMLTKGKKEEALHEYHRVLKPGGLLLTHDVCLFEYDLTRQRDLRYGLSRTINVNVEPLTKEDWKDLIERCGFKTKQKYGPMTLMSPRGMIHDEGLWRGLKIVRNGLKKENRQMFRQMFTFFRANAKSLGFIANLSTNCKEND